MVYSNQEAVGINRDTASIKQIALPVTQKNKQHTTRTLNNAQFLILPDAIG